MWPSQAPPSITRHCSSALFRPTIFVKQRRRFNYHLIIRLIVLATHINTIGDETQGKSRSLFHNFRKSKIYHNYRQLRSSRCSKCLWLSIDRVDLTLNAVGHAATVAVTRKAPYHRWIRTVSLTPSPRSKI